MESPLLVSVQVGVPRRCGTPGDDRDEPWSSAIVKEPVMGPVRLGRTNLAGDEQADKKNHGGPDQAVLAYSADHYAAWREEPDLPKFPHGAFGENFTIAGLTEDTVCIGDTYAIGDVRVQVTQPRTPCWKIPRRWGIQDLTARVERTGRTGWYLRVLREGEVAAGTPVVLLERPHPEWTVTRAATVRRGRGRDREATAALAALPELSEGWRTALRRFLEHGS